jgi:hypothetical protein
MESGVVIASIVGDDDDASAPARAGGTKVFQKLEAGEGVELIPLGLKEESAIAQSDGPEIPDALAGEVVEKHRILDFWGNPHPTTRAVLLEVHFVHNYL